MNHIITQENKPFHLYTFLLMLYFCIAPLEDLLTSKMGTLAKYIALIIVFIGIVEKELSLSISLSRANLCLIWLMVLSVLSCVWAIDMHVASERITAYLMVPGICLFFGCLTVNSPNVGLSCPLDAQVRSAQVIAPWTSDSHATIYPIS